MKLQSIKIKKSTSTTVQNIKRTIQGVQTVGYINLIARNKVETVKGKPKIYKSKTGRKLGILALKAKQKVNKYASTIFNQCFVQAGIFEGKIAQCKKALKDAKKQMLTTLEYFNLHVNLSRAILHTKQFRYSLPSYIANLLF